MERERVTCPETGHLEDVELERTPAGIVVADCSGLHRNGAVECPRECARRMDRRDQLLIDDRTERVLIAYASDRRGKAKLAAEVLSDHLTRDRLAVELADAEAAPPPQDYDAVVIGCSGGSCHLFSGGAPASTPLGLPPIAPSGGGSGSSLVPAAARGDREY